MTHVVTSACVRCKYQDCVAVCPVECFHEADEYLVIDPDECIDCAACVPECPVDAIYADTDLPDEEMEWLDRNEEEAQTCPSRKATRRFWLILRPLSGPDIGS